MTFGKELLGPRLSMEAAGKFEDFFECIRIFGHFHLDATILCKELLFTGAGFTLDHPSEE
jgi:hypothetical protein